MSLLGPAAGPHVINWHNPLPPLLTPCRNTVHSRLPAQPTAGTATDPGTAAAAALQLHGRRKQLHQVKEQLAATGTAPQAS
jgi:hypothetical protein